MSANKVFRVPVQAYDLSTGELVAADRYFSGQPMGADTWINQMLKAQGARKRLAYSNEWSGAQRHYRKTDAEQEKKLVDTAAWTGTVLDFNDETLKEDIVLNPDGTIASAKTLGKKDKIVLPHASGYVKDLPDACVRLVAYLHGVANPKRELPDYAYVWVNANGIKPVVRSAWLVGRRDGGRVGVDAGCGPAGGGFAAWQVDEKRPENVITPQEYAEMLKESEELAILVE